MAFDSGPVQAQAEAMGLSWDEIKAGIKQLIPLLEVVARMTPNTYDDVAVQFLKAFFGVE